MGCVSSKRSYEQIQSSYRKRYGDVKHANYDSIAERASKTKQDFGEYDVDELDKVEHGRLLIWVKIYYITAAASPATTSTTGTVTDDKVDSELPTPPATLQSIGTILSVPAPARTSSISTSTSSTSTTSANAGTDKLQYTLVRVPVMFLRPDDIEDTNQGNKPQKTGTSMGCFKMRCCCSTPLRGLWCFDTGRIEWKTFSTECYVPDGQYPKLEDMVRRIQLANQYKKPKHWLDCVP
jgi:hypothetical protein